ncbi:hypothetical protein [Catenuloplanes indicus]|uniref:Uncharacterized protein n=1 Tax=Catenuloplanes indicus TaxID=137267 RepID=A0AAE3W7R1_9ACTN|nr:hypothetical protein [Catenuloplanes indicus]MDQ0370057.1 hypothetical protein [Catenuloplanes indicus]
MTRRLAVLGIVPLLALPAGTLATSAAPVTNGAFALAAVRAPEETGKYYVVGPPINGQREFLFQIAAKTLGDGNRYPEIVALNEGRPQPDGRSLTDPTSLEPGWILVLPEDASGSGVKTGPLPAITPAAPAPGTAAPAVTSEPPPAAAADGNGSAEPHGLDLLYSPMALRIALIVLAVLLLVWAQVALMGRRPARARAGGGSAAAERSGGTKATRPGGPAPGRERPASGRERPASAGRPGGRPGGEPAGPAWPAPADTEPGRASTGGRPTRGPGGPGSGTTGRRGPGGTAGRRPDASGSGTPGPGSADGTPVDMPAGTRARLPAGGPSSRTPADGPPGRTPAGGSPGGTPYADAPGSTRSAGTPGRTPAGDAPGRTPAGGVPARAASARGGDGRPDGGGADAPEAPRTRPAGDTPGRRPTTRGGAPIWTPVSSADSSTPGRRPAGERPQPPESSQSWAPSTDTFAPPAQPGRPASPSSEPAGRGTRPGTPAESGTFADPGAGTRQPDTTGTFADPGAATRQPDTTGTFAGPGGRTGMPRQAGAFAEPSAPVSPGETDRAGTFAESGGETPRERAAGTSEPAAGGTPPASHPAWVITSSSNPADARETPAAGSAAAASGERTADAAPRAPEAADRPKPPEAAETPAPETSAEAARAPQAATERPAAAAGTQVVAAGTPVVAAGTPVVEALVPPRVPEQRAGEAPVPASPADSGLWKVGVTSPGRPGQSGGFAAAMPDISGAALLPASAANPFATLVTALVWDDVPADVRLIGARPARWGSAYGWLDGGQAPPSAGAPVVLGEHDGRRLWVDLAVAPDAVTLGGDAAAARRHGLALVTQLGEETDVLVIGDVLGETIPGRCRRIESVAALPADRSDAKVRVLVCAGADAPALASPLRAMPQGRQRTVPLIIGPAPAARWSVRFGAVPAAE